MQSKSRLQRALQGTRLREMIADVRQEVRDAIQEFSVSPYLLLVGMALVRTPI